MLVNVLPNEAPVLDDPGNQSIPATQDTLDVTLSATDPMNDPLVFSATAESIEYYLDQTLELQLGPGGLFENWSGSQNEKWVLGGDGVTWYFVTPDGDFWRWLGGDKDIAANSEFVARLTAGTYDDPTLLYEAQQGAAAPATVTVAGDTLTIDPDDGFVGSFSVLVTVTDSGGLSDSRLIRVDVGEVAPAGVGVLGLVLEAEGEGSPTLEGGTRIRELGFAQPDSRGVVAPSDAGEHAELDSFFSDPEGVEDLLNEDVADNLMSSWA
jgi:hypothetical protein